jgi:hypothetical protein
LIRCAEVEPGRFAQICVALLPRDIDVNVSVTHEIRETLELFRNRHAPPKLIDG